MKTLAPVLTWALGLIGPLLAWPASAGADADPSPIDRSKDNPALARFGRSVILYASFDGHANAEITADDPQPPGNAEWKAGAKNRDHLFAPGVFGQGLRSGRHQLVFTSPKAGLGSTGSVVLWLKAEQLQHRGTYCWPVILDALEGNEDVFVYDEFLVLDVPLSHADVRRLYDEGTKMLAARKPASAP